MNLSSLCRFVVFIGSFTPGDFGYNLVFYVQLGWQSKAELTKLQPPTVEPRKIDPLSTATSSGQTCRAFCLPRWHCETLFMAQRTTKLSLLLLPLLVLLKRRQK